MSKNGISKMIYHKTQVREAMNYKEQGVEVTEMFCIFTETAISQGVYVSSNSLDCYF